MESKIKLLIINGSIRGEKGNCGAVIEHVADFLQTKNDVVFNVLTLTGQMPDISEVFTLLDEHDAFVIVTGNYWGNWGSSMQRFIEVVTIFENSSAFFGKPISTVVTMDSVGGSDVASRLHAVFSGLGCWSPPCSTVVLSRTGQAAVQSTAGQEDDPNEDVWRISDVNIVLENLITSARMKVQWISWPHAELRIDNGPWPTNGPLDLGSIKFI